MSAPWLILGATTGIGRLTLDAALAQGHSVRGFARTADTLPEHPNLEPVAGDATDPDVVAKAVDGVSAVIYALGVKERPFLKRGTVSLFSRSTSVLLPAMKAAGVKRLVLVTGFGAGRSKMAMSTVEKAGHSFLLGRFYRDKDVQEDMVMASDLDWTIVRPVILTNGAATGSYKILRDPTEWHNGLISRADVADYLVKATEQGLDVGKDVVLAR